MTVFVGSGSTIIPSSVGRLRVVMNGEGSSGSVAYGTGVVGSATTFLGMTAFGGKLPQAGTGGLGGTTFVPPSFLSGVAFNQNGNPGSDGSGTVQNTQYPYPWQQYSVGTGGIGVTYTSPSLQQDYYRGFGGNGSSSQPTPNGVSTGQHSGQLAAGQHNCQAATGGGQVNCGTSGQYTQCCYAGQSKTFYGGHGAGGFIDVTFRSSQITQYLGTTQNFFVNGTESAPTPDNTINSGSLELYYLFPECYIKTSNGWQLIKNVHVRAGTSGWKESVNLVLLPEIPIPMLSIVAWSGAIADIPNGWALCDGSTVELSDGTNYTLPNLHDTILRGSPNASSRNTFVGSNNGWSATTTTNGAHNPDLPFYYGSGTGSNIGNANNDSSGGHFHTLTADYTTDDNSNGFTVRNADHIGVKRVAFIASITAASTLPVGSWIYCDERSSSNYSSGLERSSLWATRNKFLKGRTDDSRNYYNHNYQRFISPNTIIVSESGNHTHKSQYDNHDTGSVCENYGGCSNEASVGIHTEHWTPNSNYNYSWRYRYYDNAHDFLPLHHEVTGFKVIDNTSIDPKNIIIATLADYYQNTSVWKKCDGTNGTLNLTSGIHPRMDNSTASSTSGSNDSFTIDVNDSNTFNGNYQSNAWQALDEGLVSYNWNHSHKNTNTVGPVNSNAATEWHTNYEATHEHSISTITIERQTKAYNIDFIQYKI